MKRFKISSGHMVGAEFVWREAILAEEVDAELERVRQKAYDMGYVQATADARAGEDELERVKYDRDCLRDELGQIAMQWAVYRYVVQCLK